ncbi:MAG: UbiH/UbiF/VisC/COQ6 family ubiquinone biosynthesis hydroxylase [Halothiobacillaceae bacterium]|nr:UbiH/UbiF/VisC/COQ6 family ubiquinone biosynthesis hydroxylase [Halothiobacillaceae bacterium]
MTTQTHTPHPPHSQHDVIVVGGGMVGASIALALGQIGWQVALVEDQPIPTLPDAQAPFDIRVSALSPKSIAFLQQLGVWPTIRHTRSAPYRRMRVWDAAGGGDVTFQASDTGLPELGFIVENSLIQAALWQAITNTDTITCFRHSHPTHWHIEGNKAQLCVNGEHRLSAQLLIGADGAKSWVRTAVGITDTHSEYDTAAQVLSVRTDYPQQDITWQRFTPRGPQAFLPLAGNHASLVWYDQIEAVKQRHSLTDEALLDELKAQFPTELGRITGIETRGYFPIRRMHATRYTAERAVILGDAAHTIHPLAGQGVNLGFYDVMALAECLKNTDDLGAPKALNRYERMRRADNLITQTGMDAFHFGFRTQNPWLIGARNLGLTTVASLSPLRKIVSRLASGQR